MKYVLNPTLFTDKAKCLETSSANEVGPDTQAFKQTNKSWKQWKRSVNAHSAKQKRQEASEKRRNDNQIKSYKAEKDSIEQTKAHARQMRTEKQA